MSKDKEKKTNAMRMVERAKVPYNVYHYAWKEDALDAVHAAAELQRPTDQVFKTLVAIGDKTGPVVGVIPSDQELDLKKFARASGNKRVEMLHLKDLEKTTGYIRGGCSPIGVSNLRRRRDRKDRRDSFLCWTPRHPDGARCGRFSQRHRRPCCRYHQRP